MRRRAVSRSVAVLSATLTLGTAPAHGQSGAELYRAACAACHGGDGKGAPATQVGFRDPPIPDFTDCSFASREAAQDWYAVVHAGGPVRAFSRRMPSFGEALTSEQIERVVTYVRSLCRDASWPRGELNLPRALATEKAFPEDEIVVTAEATTRQGTGEVTSAFVYEKRIGARNQWELIVPVGAVEGAGGWTGGHLGDISLALKRALVHDGEKGRILSAAAEVVLPTGDARGGIGSGTTVFEPFLLAAQVLPYDSFLQLQTGLELSANRAKAGSEAFGRVALGTTLASGFGRAWSPMVEVLAARELERGTGMEWDVIPQMQVSLSRRQHILASLGLRLPMTDRGARPRQLVAYVLWDWFDGGLLDGW